MTKIQAYLNVFKTNTFTLLQNFRTGLHEGTYESIINLELRNSSGFKFISVVKFRNFILLKIELKLLILV
jgi:hypothetical protein